ncbi:serine hydrolase domain-containing protein [Allorhizobium terrae]|uniref:Serine hydrolase n=1 Tax=Allorhizobium terrae TaxID=1848972 RepID=A0A4S4A2U0_9HYPH|nr:serine hydrolase [Allorhizobium terrae]THF52222.1 serine hydrolase [Allorhizobium terrae]
MTLKIHGSVLLALAISTSVVHAEESKWLTPTMVNARAAMMDPSLNFLTFQNLDHMFATRTVEAGKAAAPLPRAIGPIGDKFTFDGKDESLNSFLESTATNALLVIKDGKIVQEVYRNGSHDTTRFMSFSMAKSLLATMIGIAVSEGKIKSVNDKVEDYLPSWKGTAYAGVRILDLLRMRSGIDWQEVYKFGSDTQLTEVHNNSLVGYKYRWCDYARDKAKTLNPPGKVFNYSTLDTSVLGCVLEAAVGQKGANYMSEKIWKPAGMEASAYYLLDGPEDVGREFYGAGYNATLRDYGRFGLMMLNGGKANGHQVVPKDWVALSTRAPEDSSLVDPDVGVGYAYQWWTVHNSPAYSAIGLFNQYTYVNPETHTVIVKLDAPASPLGFDKDNLAFFKKISENLTVK